MMLTDSCKYAVFLESHTHAHTNKGRRGTACQQHLVNTHLSTILVILGEGGGGLSNAGDLSPTTVHQDSDTLHSPGGGGGTKHKAHPHQRARCSQESDDVFV